MIWVEGVARSGLALAWRQTVGGVEVGAWVRAEMRLVHV